MERARIASSLHRRTFVSPDCVPKRTAPSQARRQQQRVFNPRVDPESSGFMELCAIRAPMTAGRRQAVRIDARLSAMRHQIREHQQGRRRGRGKHRGGGCGLLHVGEQTARQSISRKHGCPRQGIEKAVRCVSRELHEETMLSRYIAQRGGHSGCQRYGAGIF